MIEAEAIDISKSMAVILNMKGCVCIVEKCVALGTVRLVRRKEKYGTVRIFEQYCYSLPLTHVFTSLHHVFKYSERHLM